MMKAGIKMPIHCAHCCMRGVAFIRYPVFKSCRLSPPIAAEQHTIAPIIIAAGAPTSESFPKSSKSSKDENKIVASGTLLIENKIIHGISKVGHIEDIVVDSKSRGLGLGKKIVSYLTNLAKENNCYKVILNCKEENCGFYEKCGYVRKETEMVQYFE